MERVLQLGTGRFLRGFVDSFIDDANVAAASGTTGTPARAVTAVETTGSGMAARLAAQGGAYRLLVRGLEHGAIVDTSRIIRAIDRTVDGATDPAAVIAAALDPDVRFLVSNTTEAGYDGGIPARLCAVLDARARAGLPGLVILPCELIERNGDRLRALVTADATARGLDPGVIEHVRDANTWAVTLVDRITTRPGADVPGTFGDPLAVAVEPFASWVVEAPAGVPIIEHARVERTADVLPYALRKIRILNGAHTALVVRTRGIGVRYVREAMEDPAIAAWMEALMLEEIVPALGERIVDGAAFARTTIERFRNPFQDHHLEDIAIHHDQKLVIRLVPTYRDHVERFGRAPRLLGQVLAQEGVLP